MKHYTTRPVEGCPQPDPPELRPIQYGPSAIQAYKLQADVLLNAIRSIAQMTEVGDIQALAFEAIAKVDRMRGA